MKQIIKLKYNLEDKVKKKIPTYAISIGITFKKSFYDNKPYYLDIFDYFIVRNKIDKQLLDKIHTRIDKKYQIYSYHKYVDLYERNKINLKNSLIIIDEVQNIVSETGSFYKIILESLQKSPASTRIVALSATPIFDQPMELGLTLNLLRPKTLFPIGDNFEG